jgi:catechol 2,3-dioxygenase
MSPTDLRPVLPAALRLGAVHLTVRELDRSVACYRAALGLRVHEQDGATAVLGDGEEAVAVLHGVPDALPKGRHAGLFHFCLLYPTREELARAAARLAATGTPIEGASDHGTHEAIYLPDPDGNGLELAWDRAPELWPEAFGPPARLDLPGLLGLVEGEPPAEHVAPGLRIGHLHLHVGDVAEAVAFYRDLLGLELNVDWGTAAFLAAGDYHHHLGVNVWNGAAVTAPPPGSVGLRHWTVRLPDAEDVEAVRARLAGHPLTDADGGFAVADPWGTVVRVVAAA